MIAVFLQPTVLVRIAEADEHFVSSALKERQARSANLRCLWSTAAYGSTMREITPEALLEQLVSFIELFVAQPADQNSWVDGTHFPAEEIALQYYDLLGVSRSRLREHGLIDAQDEELLVGLERYVHGVQTKLFINHSEYVDGWYVRDAPEWLHVRELASAALTSLRRAKAAKAG